jgi:hypothetical protein
MEWITNDSGFDSWQRQDIFLFSTTPILTLGLNQYSFLAGVFLRDKAPGH